MKYEQITQTSRPYEYGEGKEFLTKEEAEKKIKKLEQKIKTDMAINGMYKLSETKIVEIDNVLQLVVVTKIPKML